MNERITRSGNGNARPRDFVLRCDVTRAKKSHGSPRRGAGAVVTAIDQNQANLGAAIDGGNIAITQYKRQVIGRVFK